MRGYFMPRLRDATNHIGRPLRNHAQREKRARRSKTTQQLQHMINASIHSTRQLGPS